MKIFGKVLLFLVIIVPIVFCVTTLNSVWKEEDTVGANVAKESGDMSNYTTDNNVVFMVDTICPVYSLQVFFSLPC